MITSSSRRLLPGGKSEVRFHLSEAGIEVDDHHGVQQQPHDADSGNDIDPLTLADLDILAASTADLTGHQLPRLRGLQEFSHYPDILSRRLPQSRVIGSDSFIQAAAGVLSITR